jgi:hypothetical protein
MSNKNRKRSVNTTVNTPVEKTASMRSASHTTSVEFNPDYSYVKKDLARIGILAGSFFIILVVLSFFLR